MAQANRDDVVDELLEFLEYEGTCLVQEKIAELAQRLETFATSFAGTSALRKLLECKEAFLRAKTLAVREANAAEEKAEE